MRIFLAALVLLSSPANAEAVIRYYYRIHIFFDDGLKIYESKESYGTIEACDKAGERDAARYHPRLMANFLCEPMHMILNNGGRYT